MTTKQFLESILHLSFRDRINAANKAYIPLDELLKQSDYLLNRSLGVRRHELESLKKMYAVSGWDKMLNIFNSTVIAGDSMVDYGFLTANVLDFSEMLKTGIPFECVDLENPDEPLEKVHQALFFSGVGK